MATGEALRKWRKANQYRLAIDLNRNSETDKPLIEKLEEQPNKSAYVKRLIQQDIDGGESGK